MYKFVKIRPKNSDKNGYWYFVPNSVDQVQEHFTKIFGSEISAGVKDKFDSIWIPKHPETPWRYGVDTLNRFSGNPWIVDAVNLENEALNNRINDFLNYGKIYLADGVQEFWYREDMFEIIEEVERAILAYPREEQFRFEEVRYMQWEVPGFPKGEHWYAKIGNLDVKDKSGNVKWNTKEEAMKAAEWFCQELNYKAYHNYE